MDLDPVVPLRGGPRKPCEEMGQQDTEGRKALTGGILEKVRVGLGLCFWAFRGCVEHISGSLSKLLGCLRKP